MNAFRWIGVLGVAMLLIGISVTIVRRSRVAPVESHRTRADSLTAGSSGSQPAAVVADLPGAERSKAFRALSVLERNAMLSDIRRRPPHEIFYLWQRAGAVEKDLMKQGAIATTMAYALREERPSQDLLDSMWGYVVDPQNSLRERGGVLGMFGGAKTVEGMEFLLKASKELTDSQLRRVALDQIAAVGDLRGDGSYHEERSAPAERVWEEVTDPDLLSQTAIAMAKIGTHSGINTLLKSALDESSVNGDRRRAAMIGLEQVYSRNATAPIAALLNRQTSANEASALASRILVNIGDAAASEALTRWFQNVDASAVELAAVAVARTRTPILLDAWKAAVGPSRAFRSEEVRAEIREALDRYNKGISIER